MTANREPRPALDFAAAVAVLALLSPLLAIPVGVAVHVFRWFA